MKKYLLASDFDQTLSFNTQTCRIAYRSIHSPRGAYCIASQMG